jgi:hypothetical protein
VVKEMSMQYLVELPALGGLIHQIQKSLRGLLHRRILARFLRNTEGGQRALEIRVFLPGDEGKELTPGNAILEWRGVFQYSNAVRHRFHTLQNSEWFWSNHGAYFPVFHPSGAAVAEALTLRVGACATIEDKSTTKLSRKRWSWMR